ncbi:MAG: lipopolysaccharide heptosyltransferase II [Pseudomonadales bacterium]
MDSSRRILVVGPAWVGDMVMSQCLYKVLKAQYPEATIDVLAPPVSLPLVSRMEEVSRGIVQRTGHGELKLRYRWDLGRKLRENHYEQAIVLPNSFKSALVPFLANIERRTGFRGESRYYLLNDMRLLDKRRLPRMVDRFVALGLPESTYDPARVEYPSLLIDKTNQIEQCTALSLDTSRPILGLCPGAEYGEAKKWPESHYATLADYAIQRDMQVWVFGTRQDSDTYQRIRLSMPADSREYLVDLTGKTSLLDAVDLLALSRLVVTNDSGLMHVAAAVGCPTAVIYGSTSPDFTPPLSDKTEIVSDSLPCSPCFQRTCPLGHKNCLNLLMPDRLEPIVQRHLEAPGR